MADPAVMAIRSRVELVADRALRDPAAPRSGIVEVTLRDGRMVRHFTRHPPGTKESPLDDAQLEGKVRDLVAPVLGERQAAALIARVNAIEQMGNVRELVALMTRRA